jgi:hypothetical protein
MTSALAVVVLVALSCWRCASSGSGTSSMEAHVSAQSAVSLPTTAPTPAGPTHGVSAPSASNYADRFADELLSDRDLADWRKKHALRYPDMGAVGVLVLSMRNQTSDPRMDR